jgi:cyclohexadienyl dehydratase
MNAKPKLRIGIPGDYLPFGIINEDSPLGFAGHDVDLAAELCREAGLAPLFVLTTWPTFMKDLAEGRFDIAAGGVSWVPERARLTDALPRYAPFAKVALIRRDSIDRFQTPEDLNQPDVRVIKNPGGTNERWVDTNLTRAQVATVADNATIPARIANEVGDVMITDSFEAHWYASRDVRLTLAMNGRHLTPTAWKTMLVRRGARCFPAENIRPPLPNRLPRSSFLPGVAWSAPVFFRRWLPNGWVQANLLTETLHTKKKPHNSPK